MPMCACQGMGWVEDENWQPDYPEQWRGERYTWDGYIPCDMCNPLGEEPPPRPSGQLGPQGWSRRR